MNHPETRPPHQPGNPGPTRPAPRDQRGAARGPVGDRRRLTPDRDRGSSVAEFSLVLVLLLTLFLGLLSVGLWAYARTVLTSAAADAARVAANHDVTTAVTTAHVAAQLGDGLVGATRSALTCTGTVDQRLVTVTCTMPAPGIVGLLDGMLPPIQVTGHSAKETAE